MQNVVTFAFAKKKSTRKTNLAKINFHENWSLQGGTSCSSKGGTLPNIYLQEIKFEKLVT